MQAGTDNAAVRGEQDHRRLFGKLELKVDKACEIKYVAQRTIICLSTRIYVTT